MASITYLGAFAGCVPAPPAGNFAAAAARRVDFAAAEALQKRHAAAAAVLAKAETGAGGDDRERYRDYPSAAKEAPQYCVTNLTSAPGKSQTYEFYGLPDVNN